MKTKREAIRRGAICAMAALIVGAPRPSHAAASITIVNADAAGKGLNDPTPVAPVGGNAGITVGQQRLIAFSYGATIWGAALDASVGISIGSAFDPQPPLPCSTTQGVLGAAGPISAATDLPPPARQNVWYVGPLASQLAGNDVDQGNPSISATFNPQVGSANCLPNTGWYYGLDGNTGPSQFDLVDVVLHEFAHGLGFVSLARPDGSWFAPSGRSLPDIWEFTMLDLSTTPPKHWSDMTNQERVASAIRPRKLVWDGTNARSAAPSFLVAGTPTLTASPPIAGEYLVGEALFGPPLTPEGVADHLTAPVDSTGSREGCAPFSSTLSGIVLLERAGRTCTFTAKVLNAQSAGASAVVIVNDVAGSPPPPMPGTDSTIMIPSVMITQADGLLLRNAIPQVMVNVHLLPALRGADAQGNTMLYTPDQYVRGSSISHTDLSALLLMDPTYNTRLGHKLDLTPYFFRDIGWSVSNPDPADLRADIALSVTGSKNFQKDTNVVCNLTVSNNGPSDARDVLVFGTAPDGVTFAASSGACSNGFPCSLGTMAAGTRRSFTVSFHVSPSYTDSDLKVTLNAAPPFPDPNTGNNAGTVSSHRGILGAGGCASTGLGEPALAALLLLAFFPRRSRSRA